MKFQNRKVPSLGWEILHLCSESCLRELTLGCNNSQNTMEKGYCFTFAEEVAEFSKTFADHP